MSKDFMSGYYDIHCVVVFQGCWGNLSDYMYWEENTYDVVGAPKKMGFYGYLHWFHEKMLQCPYLFLICPITNGKGLMGKTTKFGTLLRSELSHL
jgi:hypothetical protein